MNPCAPYLWLQWWVHGGPDSLREVCSVCLLIRLLPCYSSGCPMMLSLQPPCWGPCDFLTPGCVWPMGGSSRIAKYRAIERQEHPCFHPMVWQGLYPALTCVWRQRENFSLIQALTPVPFAAPGQGFIRASPCHLPPDASASIQPQFL